MTRPTAAKLHRLQPPVMLAAGLVAAACTTCQAEGQFEGEGNWRLHVGPARISFKQDVQLSAGGVELPGAGARLSDNTALLAEVAYRLTPKISLGLTFGVPPTTTVSATGTVEQAGTLGRVKYGPLVLGAQYQFNGGGTWQPYLGAGVVRFIAFSSTDAALKDLKVQNAWGSALQLGADLQMSQLWGLFVDVRKVFVKAPATGRLQLAGGAPARALARLDPLILQAGLSLHF